MIRVRVAGFTHPGAVRTQNQDTIAVSPAFVAAKGTILRTSLAADDTPFVALVADGLGGHPAGEVASRIAAESLVARLSQFGAGTEAQVAEALAAANRSIYTDMARTPERTGMGSTVAGVVVANDSIIVFNVGDSRVYRAQDGFLCKLSIDDSIAGQPRGAIFQCLGGASAPTEIFPHVSAEQWRPGRGYLVCSDGLYESIPIDALEALLTQPIEEVARALLEAAIVAGADDNVSALWILPAR